MEDEGLERAIAGALRGAIHDHGPITAKEIGSATKRIAGNLKNARPPRGQPAPLAPGEMREATLQALLCRCARCRYEWTVTGEPGQPPARPERCGNHDCHSRTWDQAVPRKAGRPRKNEPATKPARS
jgi:hypothetical protein